MNTIGGTAGGAGASGGVGLGGFSGGVGSGNGTSGDFFPGSSGVGVLAAHILFIESSLTEENLNNSHANKILARGLREDY